MTLKRKGRGDRGRGDEGDKFLSIQVGETGSNVCEEESKGNKTRTKIKEITIAESESK